MKKIRTTNNDIHAISVTLPDKGECAPINQLIKDAPQGSMIRLTKGKYLINETIKLDKSIRIVGEGIGKTVIEGKNLPMLLESYGENTLLELEGISFRNKKGKEPATVCFIAGREVKIKKCSFSGGIRSEDHEEGAGLLVRGSAKVEIDNCLFEKNEEFGLLFCDTVQGKVSNCKFTLNDLGATATGEAVLTINNCGSFKNNVGITCSDSTTGEISDCTLNENRGGVLVKGESTPFIHDNSFTANKAGIDLAENCDVRIEENEIKENEFGIMVGQDSRTSVAKNQISKNMVGIKCADETNSTISYNQIFDQSLTGIMVTDTATSKILGNKILENGRCGIHSTDQVQIEFKNNQVLGNLIFGILVTGESNLKVKDNTFRNNGIKNINATNSVIIDSQNNIEIESESRPIKYKAVENELYVTAPSPGEIVSFREMIEQSQSGQIINLEGGKYMLSEPIEIDKPLQLVAIKPGQVFIFGSELTRLIDYSGNGKLILKGISFKCIGPDKTNGIVISAGKLEMDRCKVDGAHRKENSSPYGAGLVAIEAKKVVITNSSFYDNQSGGILIFDALIDLEGNKCFHNQIGIEICGTSTGNIKENLCFENIQHGIIVQDDCECIIEKNDCHDNKQIGIGSLGNSKSNILVNQSNDNKAGIVVNHNSNPYIENNVCHGNLDGILIMDNASARVSNNKCFDNGDSGITIADNASAILEKNELYDNTRGAKIEGNARASIKGNKIYRNFGEGIANKSKNESEISDNELLDNGESSESIFVMPRGVDPGNLLAQMLGSENLSDDPNVAAIPLGNLTEGTDRDSEDQKDD